MASILAPEAFVTPFAAFLIKVLTLPWQVLLILREWRQALQRRLRGRESGSDERDRPHP